MSTAKLTRAQIANFRACSRIEMSVARYRAATHRKDVQNAVYAVLTDWPPELCHLVAVYQSPSEFHWLDCNFDGIIIKNGQSRISVIGTDHRELRMSGQRSLKLAADRTQTAFVDHCHDEQIGMNFIRVCTAEILAQTTCRWEVKIAPNTWSLLLGFEFAGEHLCENHCNNAIHINCGHWAGFFNMKNTGLTVKTPMTDSKTLDNAPQRVKINRIRFEANLETGDILVQQFPTDSHRNSIITCTLHLAPHLLRDARPTVSVWGPNVHIDIKTLCS